MKKKNKKISQRTFQVALDGTHLTGDISLDFFDNDNNFIGEITFWKEGGVWVGIYDSNITLKFKSPIEFFKSLNKKGE